MHNGTKINLDKIDKVLKENIKAENWDVGLFSELDILNAINKLKNSASSGPDNISCKIIKALKFALLKPLSHLANMSVETGVFPEIWKAGNIIPVHKKGSKLCSDNYRPIILMSNLGKILESAVIGNVMPHIDRNLPSAMHGFRPNRSTETALCTLLEEIKSERSQKKKVAILALDCSAAFDILDHDLILLSLKHLGAGCRMQSWVKSFMSNCKYTVKIGNNTSESWFPQIGVGQGRRMSPILFNIGCLSMQFWEKVGKSIVYADDGCTIISGDTMEDLNRNIEIACYDKSEWYQDAGFVINGAKSELLGINCKPDPITVAGHKVLNKSNIKFLGLHITQDLKWNAHINKLCDKARFAANKIRSEGWCFSLKDRALLYNGWVRTGI